MKHHIHWSTRKLKAYAWVVFTIGIYLLLLGSHPSCGSETSSTVKKSVGYPSRSESTELGEPSNAWPCYQKACELYVELPAEVDLRDLDRHSPGLSLDKRAIVQAWLSDNAEAIRHLRQGARRVSCWKRFDHEARDHIKPIGDLVRGLLWQVRVTALEQRDMALAEKDLMTCCQVSSHLRQGPLLIEHLVGIAILAQTSQTAFTILAETEADSAFVTRFHRSIRQELPVNLNYELRWIEGERLWAWGNIQRLFVSLNDDSPMNWLDTLLLVFLFDDREDRKSVFSLRRGQTQEDITNAYAYATEFVRTSPWQARERGLNFYEDLWGRTHHNPLARWLMFNGPSISRVRAQGQTMWDALLCCLAVWEYKYDTGHFPDELQTLISENYFTKLPADPYSDVPLVYRLTADGFMLYSVAANFVDDGGHHEDWHQGHVGGDYVFWPVQAINVEASN